MAGDDDWLRGPRRFSLDALDRVSAVTSAWADEAYTYDAAGTITGGSITQGSITRGTISAGSISAGTFGAGSIGAAPLSEPGDARDAGRRAVVGTMTRRSGRVTYEHDRAGRVTMRRKAMLSAKAQVWHYSWDAEDRLIADEVAGLGSMAAFSEQDG